jgi:superfamily II DNA or RNA helicase
MDPPMAKPDRESLLEEIARVEARLAEIESERSAVGARLEMLRAELAAIEKQTVAPSTGGQGPPPPHSVPRTSHEKIALFRSLFSGRTDVYPKYWQNPRTNKKGYSPACSNEWVRGVCDKPRVKCGECTNQAFLPVTDRMILDHLHGRHIAGVYPLLENETCSFLAVDFDKGSWKDDVGAFVDTCHRFGLSPAVERSRSGNGAHVWFFFATPTAASAARKLGCYLLTETMADRHELPMTSYDRLFPNQDTMPRGGFGNLIALPFQHAARQAGNTLFVDEHWEPHPDQWAFLAGIPRLDQSRVEELAAYATAKGQVIGVRMGELANEEDEAPWLRAPSRRKKTVRINSPLPAQVRAVLDQQLFVDKAGLPPALINQIKRIAAFQNPEFYKKQAMRLSTALTPRVISCAEDLPQHVGIPRGCRVELETLLQDHGTEVIVEDRRIEGDAIDVRFHGELSEVQQKAVQAILPHDIGVFTAPPGTGKTVVGTHLIAERGRNTLVLVHRTQLLDQWRTQLSIFLDRKQKDIGQIGGGKTKVTGQIDVAMVQSLVRRDEVKDLVAGYGHVVVDECHHVPAVSFERVMREVRARYIVGLTATPRRRDGHHPISEYHLGPVRFSIDPKSEAARRSFEHQLIIRETAFRLQNGSAQPGIQEICSQLASDGARNELILNDVVRALEEGRSPLLLTERRDHVDFFAERLRKLARHLVILQGGMGVKQRREVLKTLASIPDDEERLVLATGRFIGEGFDDARLDTLFLALPVSWKGTLIQYAGRLHRQHRSKTDVRIFDYVDRQVLMLARMFDKRMKGYRSMGYETAPGPAELFPNNSDELVIEYDQEALRAMQEDLF